MKKKLICNKQIGFIKGCGTELNLLRLKQRINDVKKENIFLLSKQLLIYDIAFSFSSKFISSMFLKETDFLI